MALHLGNTPDAYRRRQDPDRRRPARTRPHRRRQRHRIGSRRTVPDLTNGTPLRSYRVADFEDLADAIGKDNLTVLDVRQEGEYDDGHVSGAINIPLQELIDRTAEVPTGEVWIHCGSGYRASIAASMLDRSDRTVVLVDDTFDQAGKLGLTN